MPKIQKTKIVINLTVGKKIAPENLTATFLKGKLQQKTCNFVKNLRKNKKLQ
jgi:hypothetical protein